MKFKKSAGIYLELIIILIILNVTNVLSQVVISEIMPNPAKVDDNLGEYFELYNSGSESVDVNGWIVQSGVANHTFSKTGGLIIPAVGYIALCINDNQTLNGGFACDYEYLTINLANTGSDNILILDEDGVEQDRVEYNASFPFSSGISMELNDSSSDNNILANWKKATASYGLGDLGTPGSKNTASNNYSPNNSTNITVPDLNQTINQTLNHIKIILTSNIPNVTYSGTVYDDLFKLTLERKENCSVKDNVTVEYTIKEIIDETLRRTDSTGINITDTFIKEIGCSGYSATGKFTAVKAGKYQLCGKIINTTAFNASFSTDHTCSEFVVKDTSRLECDLDVDISLANNTVAENPFFVQDESVEFTPTARYNSINYNTNAVPYIIEYWIEDLFGQIVKNKYNTTNSNKKSWKADIEEENEKDKVLFIKAKLYPSCKDVNESNNLAQKIIIITNKNGGSTSANIETTGKNTGNNTSTSQTENSSISITEVTPSEAEFGSMIKVDVEIYKGNTAKYSLSTWMEKDGREISEKTKVNLYTKYTNYKLSLPIKLDEKCNLENGRGKVIVEGLGDVDEKSISLVVDKQLCDSQTSSITNLNSASSNSAGTKTISATTTTKYSAELVSFPTIVQPAESMDVKVKFTGDKNDHIIKVWSYLYRGSKCYSCADGRLANDAVNQEVNLFAHQTKTADLLLRSDASLEEGQYKLKVKINKDNQKTNQEITQDVYVTAGRTSSKNSLDNFELQQENSSVSLLSSAKSRLLQESKLNVQQQKIRDESTGFVAYESSSKKSLRLVPYFLAITFVLVAGIVLWKNVGSGEEKKTGNEESSKKEREK